jgi:hypothetical protein
MSRACSKCGTQHDRKGQKYCASCHAAYMREWRKTHELNDGHRQRDIARSIASVAKKRGKLSPEPCRVCGHPDSQMHHPDHELPRLVVWLCRPCHLAWHAHWRALSQRAWQQWLSKNDRQSEAA